ncbi:DUF4065 domain-containing protein [Jiella sp. MQZ9-1]|uniref:DUF4065 domain-containing protein n=1 Tax=Jiella flava TaxID=2816857 RepID=A0A939JRE1_9HYPH|nr:type II toxin-antitoxin system antitoxin SocA domain-containing protein [Jiella flava]MBO0661818.1 DUF4065 domain-containing protein [Jiella flava]MCD2470458.1 DUF4065 domain-containing protein [Jiella flava]
MYDARFIANWFVSRAASEGKRLTIMQLLKLVYIAHGWHLEMRKAPLVLNKIEAWKYGPVIPDVYAAYRNQGVEITAPLSLPSGQIEPSDRHLLEQIYQIYGSMGAVQLSNLTHEPGGPWDTATRQRGWFAPIPNDLIRAHYESKRAAAKNV